MKKNRLAALTLSAALGLSLTACGGGTSSTPPNPTAPSDSAPPQNSAAAVALLV